jgi:CheY-like chemotaxis protein
MAAAGQQSVPGSQRSGPTILVVDDEVMVRMMIAQELRIAGFLVVETASPGEALEVLANRDDIAVVFTDVCMHGPVDGIAFARRLRSQPRDLKIVLTSGHLAAAEAIEHDGFFPKPCNVRRLIEHMRALVVPKNADLLASMSE